MSGSFEGTITFGSSTLISAGSSDIFLVKLDPTGSPIWSKQFGDASTQTPRGVAVDADGHVLITGSFDGSVNFGGATLQSNGTQNIFVAKFDTSGGHVWSKGFGSTGNQVAEDIAVEPTSGDAIITGWLTAPFGFGNGTLAVDPGNWNVFVARLDAVTGNAIWSHEYGESGFMTGSAVHADPAGNIIVGGSFSGTMTFGSDTLSNASAEDIFVARLDGLGNADWGKRFGGAGIQTLAHLMADDAGHIILAGNFETTISFGCGVPFISSGAQDAYVAKLDPVGTCQWSRRFGDTGRAWGSGIAVDSRRPTGCTVPSALAHPT